MNDLNKLSKQALIDEVKRLRLLIEGENKLQESDRKLKFQAKLLESVGQAIIATNPEGTIEYLNPAAEKLYGWTAQEAIGKVIMKIIVPEVSVQQATEIMETLNNGESWSGEFKVRNKEGKQFNAMVSDVPIFNNDGNIEHIIGISSDISARKEVEAELEKQIELFSLVINSAPTRIFWKDINSVYLGCNTTFAKDAGLQKSEDIIGLNDDDLVWSEDAEIYRADDQDVMRTGIPKLNYEETFINVEGETVYWRTSKKPLRNLDGEIIGIVAVSVNTTEEKKAEEILQDSKKRLTAIFENTSDYQLLVEVGKNNTFNVAAVNKSYIKRTDKLGVPIVEHNVIGKSLEELLGTLLFTKEETNAIIKNYIKVAETKEKLEFNEDLKINENDYYSEISLTPVLDTEGNCQYILYNSHEITEKRIAELKLRESEAYLKEAQTIAMLGNFRHDFQEDTLWWSDETFRIFGFDKSDIPPNFETFSKRLNNEDKEKLNILIEKAEKHGEDYSITYRYQIPNKDLKYVFVKVQVVFDSEGKPKGLVGAAQDVTERKKAEVALSESEKRYQSLFTDSPVPLWEEDFSEVKVYIESLKKRNIGNIREYLDDNPDIVKECAKLAKISDINNSVLKLHDAKSKEELINGLPSIFTDKSYDAFKEELIAIAEGKLECEFEGNVKTLTGKEKEIYLKWMVVPGYEENLEKVYISTYDITVQKTAQNAVIESEEKFRKIFEQSPLAIQFYDSDGNLVEVNQQTLNLFGLTDIKYVMGFNLWNDPSLSDDRKEALRNGQPIFITSSYDFNTFGNSINFPTNRTGIIFLDMYVMPMKQEGTLLGFLVQIVEVTDKIHADKALKLNEERLRLSTEVANIAVWEYDYEKKLMERSSNHDKLYGIEQLDSGSIDTFLNAIHPDDRERSISKIEKAIIPEGANQYDFDFKVIWPDKSLHWLSIFGEVAKRDKDGNALLIRGCLWDISERKKVENELVKYRERLEELVKERTNELEEKNNELERLNELFVGREFRIKELKEKIKNLEATK